ncbi:AAA family ATPase [Cerasicoccus frondis]|uniref:AAA family ATPase n=1 Tax=Cerasicoccus frondis TaxID=490090 RepID=UPI0028527140|nr:AAA family ATPase [Cerasicoccus frondis]
MHALVKDITRVTEPPTTVLTVKHDNITSAPPGYVYNPVEVSSVNKGNSKPQLQFLKPSQIAIWEPPLDYCLVGDHQISRESVSVIAGPPGCGKSRAVVSLAVAGAKGQGSKWMGYKIHIQFRTLIIQNENGRYRLRNEIRESLGKEVNEMDEWIRITPPPEHGLAFNDPSFCQELRKYIEEFKPQLIIIDPWTNVTADDNRKEYKAALENILATLPPGSNRPALLIVAHTRKASTGQDSTRKRGRDLLNEISGSFVLTSTARTAFILEPVSPDPNDDRIVFTCAKCNDGRMPAPTAWHRRNGLFTPCEDFDFDAYYHNTKSNRRAVTEDHIKETLSAFTGLARKQAAKDLMIKADVGRSAAYDALKKDGAFGHLIREGDDGKLYLNE